MLSVASSLCRLLFNDIIHNRSTTRIAMNLSSSVDNDEVKIENRRAIRLIGINRPSKRNCVNHKTAKKLISAFEQFNDDTTSLVAILHGTGGTFCAGYDLSEVSSGQFPTGAEAKQFLQKYRFMGPSMMQMKKPIIAAIDGYAVAGGLELALMCDLRVADADARFGVFCRRFGVPLIDGGTVRLPRLIGLSRAMDMILTGREIDARTAFDWGLVNRLALYTNVIDGAVELAESLLQFPQECMRKDRASALYATYSATSLQNAFDYELNEGVAVLNEAQQNATKFTTGIGKHGSFENIDKSKL